MAGPVPHASHRSARARVEAGSPVARGTGADALAAAESGSFDVVLCDVGRPDIDGQTVARRIRARPGGGRPRLIAVSGFSRGTDLSLSRAAGFDAHLTKPLPLTDLLEFPDKPVEGAD
ncbi:response regulator [Streptomyces griseorubiginosus]|uniref:response regulator n=1 Tax=Streptomyces griseorubiginosus TaxID=67304 RepID=UPI0036E07CA3